MLRSSAVRGLGLTVLATSALTVGLALPATGATSASTTTGATSLTQAVDITGTTAASSKKADKKNKKAKARKKKRRQAYRKAKRQAVKAARADGTYTVDRTLRDIRITESSGLARSSYKRNMMFTHNDSGDSNRIFVLNKAGRTRAVLRLAGASNNDWEDISTGPDRSLWVGDIGDNPRKRRTIAVHRFTEPRKPPKKGKRIKVASTRYNFAYGDGESYDAEALLVHPRTGRVHIVTKRRADEGVAGVWVAPETLSTSKVNTLTRIADAPERITAGAFSPDGSTIVLSNYTHSFTYGKFSDTPTETRLPARRQGESLEIHRNGTSVLLGSEGRLSSIFALPMAAKPTDTEAAPAPTPAPDSTPAPSPTPAPVDSCRAPAYVSDHTYFGTSLSASDGNITEALATNDKLFGRMPVVRQFDPTVPPWGAWSRRTALHDRTLVVSFREHPDEIVAGQHDAQILDYFKNAPTRKPIFWSYFHEPEPHIANGTFTHAEYRAAWRHVVDLVGTLCKPNLHPTLVLTGWTTEAASKRDWRDYYPGDEYISVVSWDPYNSATTTPTQYRDPAKLFASVVKASKESGKPWGIAETGTALVPGDDGTQRAAWLDRTARYFKDQGAAWVTYFQSTRDGKFKLTDDVSVNAWRKWVQQSVR